MTAGPLDLHATILQTAAWRCQYERSYVSSMPETTITIAVMAPFGTAEAIVADPMFTAVVTAANQAVALRSIELQILRIDDGRIPDRAIDAFMTLIEDPTLVGVIGPKNSGTALAVAPFAASSSIPLLLPCATADNLCAYETVWRMCATDTQTAAAAVRLALELDTRRLIILADDTSYGQNLAAVISHGADTHEIINTVTHPDNGDSFETWDTVFLAMGEVEQAQQLRTLRRAGFLGHTIGAEGGPRAPLPDLAGAAAEGHWLLYAGAPGVSDATVYAAEAADGATTLVQAAIATPDPTDRLARLTSIRTTHFQGRSGEVRFLPSGERHGARVSTYRVRNGVCIPMAHL